MELLDDILNDDKAKQEEIFIRVRETLENPPFNCKQPRLAIEMIKRRIRIGGKNLITIEQINRWGNRKRAENTSTRAVQNNTRRR